MTQKDSLEPFKNGKKNKENKPRRNKNTPRSLRKEEAWRDIFTILRLSKKKRSKHEQKRVEDFKERQKKLPPFDEKCKVCGTAIPKPLEYCSSECRKNAKKDTISD